MLVARASEALTLYTHPHLEQIYDREEILRERDLSGLPRRRVDIHVAKVLPPNSRVVVDEGGTGPLVRVHECAYRPFFRKELFCLRELLEPAPGLEPTSAPPLPPRHEILARLRQRIGTRYFFGGSCAEGSPSQAEILIGLGFFERDDAEEDDLYRVMCSAGLDCSGLFNEASGYHYFGDSKDVYRVWREGLVKLPPAIAREPHRLAHELRPLDILVYRGHILFVADRGEIIQSVGDGPNAHGFALEAGFDGPAMERYDRVAADEILPILRALLLRQGRALSPTWHLDDEHLMLVRIPDLAE